MKIRALFSLLLTFMMILGFYGSAWAPGGSPEPGPCDEFPEEICGQFVIGTFTAARDKNTLDIDLAHYNVHVRLRMGHEIHLFSFYTDLLPPDEISENDCYYTALCEVAEAFLMDWEYGHGKQPCLLGVAEAFGFPSDFTPVITSLTINERDFCGCEDAMISGKIIIRLVPPECPMP